MQCSRCIQMCSRSGILHGMALLPVLPGLGGLAGVSVPRCVRGTTGSQISQGLLCRGLPVAVEVSRSSSSQVPLCCVFAASLGCLGLPGEWADPQRLLELPGHSPGAEEGPGIKQSL